jgi:hypothetical protein
VYKIYQSDYVATQQFDLDSFLCKEHTTISKSILRRSKKIYVPIVMNEDYIPIPAYLCISVLSMVFAYASIEEPEHVEEPVSSFTTSLPAITNPLPTITNPLPTITNPLPTIKESFSNIGSALPSIATLNPFSKQAEPAGQPASTQAAIPVAIPVAGGDKRKHRKTKRRDMHRRTKSKSKSKPLV